MGAQRRLGDILLGKGAISAEQLESALKGQASSGGFLGAILVERYGIAEKDVLEALGEQLSLSIVDLTDAYIDWKTVTRFSPSLIIDYRCFPVRSDSRCVIMAVENPFDAWALKRAEEEARPLAVKLALCPRNGMDEAITRYKEYLKGTRGTQD